jgi:hypothetical protein
MAQFDLTQYDPQAAADQMQLDRKMAIAKMLRDQASQPFNDAQMVSGRVLSISPFQALAKLGTGYMAGRAENIADAKKQAMIDALTGKRSAWMNEMPKATTTQTPADYAQFDNTDTIQGLSNNQTTNPTSQDYLGWAMKGMNIDPNTAQFGMKYADIAENRDMRTQQAKEMAQSRQDAINAQLQARRDTFQAQEEARKEAAQQNFQNQMQLRQFGAQLANANRPQPAPTITTIQDPKNPDNMMTIDARSYRGGSVGAPGVIGVSGKSAAAQQKALTVDAGRKNVSGMVTNLYDMYDQLDKGGGITNPQDSALHNVGAWLSSSGVGQIAGQAVGSKNQSLRNNIEQTRPLLLSAIKNATGMSAQQMNSNAELKFYLNAATDPKLDVKANREALQRLDQMYGLSGQHQSNPMQPMPQPMQQPQAAKPTVSNW